MKQKKRIVSFNLEDSLIARLDRFAEEKHNGNRSRALAFLVSTIKVSLDDFPNENHTAPSQNYRDTGKCNPFYNGLAPCPTCWGENVRVSWSDGIVNGRMSRVLVVEDLE